MREATRRKEAANEAVLIPIPRFRVIQGGRRPDWGGGGGGHGGGDQRPRRKGVGVIVIVLLGSSLLGWWGYTRWLHDPAIRSARAGS